MGKIVLNMVFASLLLAGCEANFSAVTNPQSDAPGTDSTDASTDISDSETETANGEPKPSPQPTGPEHETPPPSGPGGSTPPSPPSPGGDDGSGDSGSDDGSAPADDAVVFATHDLDSDGRLDHFSLRFGYALSDAAFPGYMGANAIGGAQSGVAISGFANCVLDTSVAGDVVDDAVVYLACDEAADVDTSAIPAVSFADGFKVTYKTGNQSEDVASMTFSSEDKAPPIIFKAFAFKHEQKIRIYFSEPITGTAVDGRVTAADLAYVDHQVGDANGISSVIDGEGSDRIITIRSSGLASGRITDADLGGDAIACAPASVSDQAGNAASMTSSAAIKRKLGPDFNGDGREDLIIGAPGAINGGITTGSVYLFYGGNISGSTILGDADVKLDGTTNGARWGQMATSAGDINNDGFDDVLIGAPDDDALGANYGKAYVFFGGSMAAAYDQTEADIVIHNTGSGVYYGQAGVYIGDLSGDFIDDLVIGGNKANSDKGRVDLFNGRSTWATSLNHGDASSVIIGTGSPCGRMGTAIGYGGDLNGDGLTDIVLGDYNFGCSNSGKVSVFYGGSLSASQLDTASNAFILGGSAWKNLGQSAISAGDVNDDGYDDLITGRPYSIGPNNSGQLYVYFGQNLGTNESPATADVTIGGDGESGSLHGDPVAAVGDVNGDGIDDFAFSAVNHTAGGTARGRVYVMFGSTTLASTTVATANAVLSGDQNSESFGGQITSAGDINGDGYPDLIVAASKFDSTAGSNAGRVLLYWGGPTLSGTLTTADATVVIEGSAAGAEFGQAIGGAHR